MLTVSEVLFREDSSLSDLLGIKRTARTYHKTAIGKDKPIYLAKQCPFCLGGRFCAPYKASDALQKSHV